MMFRRFFYSLVLAAITLVACTPGKPGAVIDTGRYAVKSAYVAAQTAAVRYARLPRCSVVVKFPCSKQVTVDTLVKLDAEITVGINTVDLTAAMLKVLYFSTAVNKAMTEN